MFKSFNSQSQYLQLRKIPHSLVYNLTQSELSQFFNIDQLAFKEGFRVNLRNILVTKNPFCVLKFNYCHVKKLNSKKKTCSAFVIRGSCKIESQFLI